jgi:predicted RNase H-like HicB family nuclease
MAHFVYPAIFYYDSDYDNYAVAFPDVNIYTDGDTMEEAYVNAQEYLLSYLDCCEQLGTVPEQPSSFQKVVNDHKGENVMLVSVDYKTKSGGNSNKTDDMFEDFETNANVQNSNDPVEDLKNILENDDFSLPEID